MLMKKMSDVHKSNRGRTKTLTDSTRKRTKRRIQQTLKKDAMPTYFIFQHVRIIYYPRLDKNVGF
jgi:hypothetical protein